MLYTDDINTMSFTRDSAQAICADIRVVKDIVFMSSKLYLTRLEFGRPGFDSALAKILA